jgi:hypothetical protein
MPQHSDPHLLSLLDKLEQSVFEQRTAPRHGRDPRPAGYLALDTLVRIIQIHATDKALFGAWLPAEVESRILLGTKRAECEAVTVRP